MTATLEQTLDHEGAEITPGTLCWVRTGPDAPSTIRNSRCLAVFSQGVAGRHRWLLLIPNANTRDVTQNLDQVGWPLFHHITANVMQRLNLRRFADSHRGWWPEDVEFLETAVGHWCVEHQAFHATEECPMPDQTKANPSVLSALRTQLAEAEQRERAAVKALEDFKAQASEILADAADEHDLCGQYDEIAERAGLYRRTRDFEVVVEVTYRQQVTIHARSAGAADDLVREAGIERGWHPDSVLNIEVEGTQPPTDVAFKVIVEPPF